MAYNLPDDVTPEMIDGPDEYYCPECGEPVALVYCNAYHCWAYECTACDWWERRDEDY